MMARSIGEAFVRVRPDVSRTGQEVRRELTPQLSKAGREHGRQYGQSFGNAAGGALRSFGGTARTALAGVTGAVTGAAGAGIIAFGLKTAASLEQAQIGFETLIGSAKGARSFLGQLKSFAAKTPFELPGLIESSRTLLGVGVDAKKVIPILTAFGDAAGAVGVGQENFQRIMLATSQAVSAGRFTIEDFNQITENGIPIWKILAEATGKPVTKLRELATAGKLLSKDVLPILQKQMEKDYGGAMARQSNTLAGVWSTLKDTVAIGLANVIQPLVPVLATALPKAAAVLQGWLAKLGLGFKALFAAFREGDVTSDGFVGVMERIGVAARQVVGWVKGSLIPALVSMAQFMSRNREWVVPLVVGLGAMAVTVKVLTVATKVWAAVNLVLQASFGWIGLVIAAVIGLAAGLIYAYKHSETFRRIVQAAWQGIQTAVSWAWNNVIKPAVTALVWYFQHVIAPTALWLWRNIIQPAWQGISAAVKIAWTIIQVIFKAWVLYFRTVLFPIIRFLWNNVIKPVFKGVGDTISFYWNKVIKPVLQALGTFISKTVAPAFAKGVEAIRTAWNKVRDAARTPVDFVVNRIINPLIGGFNKVAGALGVKDRIPLISLGGGVPSQGSARLSALARRRGGDGEGTGDGLGDLLGFLKGPARWISDKAGLGRIRAAFGNTMLTNVLTGAGGKAVGWLKDKALSLFQGSEFAGGGAGVGGLAPGILGVLAALRQAFGNVPVISGLRRGAVTLTGNRSYHALGRAVDIGPVYAWAAYLNGVFGSRLRELITPWQQFNVLNGRRHTYTGAVWNQHNFAGGNAHIHAAMDDYGTRTLWPGLNIIPNNTGRPEPIGALQGMGDVHIHLHDSVIAGERQFEDMLVRGYNAAVSHRRIPAPAGWRRR